MRRRVNRGSIKGGQPSNVVIPRHESVEFRITDTMFVKEPSAPEPTPWHQDLPYFRLGGPNNCSAWIALDPANQASGAMSYALGSHRWGKMFRPMSFATGAFRTEDAFDGVAPDIDADPDHYPTIGFEVQPGDVVFHHLLTLHKAGPNSSKGTRRRVHTIRFAGDDSTWVNRPFSTVEFETDLRDGDALDGPEFPVLWPRTGLQEMGFTHPAPTMDPSRG